MLLSPGDTSGLLESRGGEGKAAVSLVKRLPGGCFGREGKKGLLLLWKLHAREWILTPGAKNGFLPRRSRATWGTSQQPGEYSAAPRKVLRPLVPAWRPLSSAAGSLTPGVKSEVLLWRSRAIWGTSCQPGEENAAARNLLRPSEAPWRPLPSSDPSRFVTIRKRGLPLLW